MRSLTFIMLITVMILCVRCQKPYAYTDNGKTIELGEDDPFQIMLEGDNSPDFNWVVESIPDFIALETMDKIDDKGRSIDYVFNFKTISYGNDVITLVYTDGREIKKTFQITVFSGVMGIITSG